MTDAVRPLDTVPLDVDGVLSLADHQRACQRGPSCWICGGTDEPTESEGRG